MNARRDRFWLALRFSDLALTAQTRKPSDQSSIVIQKKRVVFASAQAIKAGVRLGMDVTTAQVLAACETLDRKSPLEKIVLNQLSDLLYHYTPYIETHFSQSTAQAGLQLELSSCLKLFGGTQALIAKIKQELTAFPYAVAFGAAHTAKAAWLLSFAAHDIQGDETKAIFIQRLNQLPIGLVQDFSVEIDALQKMGFTLFGDIARQISAQSIGSFKRRLGKEFTLWLCDIFGIDQNFGQSTLFEKPRPVYQPKEWFEEPLQFEYPISEVDQLAPGFEHLLDKLTQYLRRRQEHAQYIEWQLADIYHNKRQIEVKSDSPQMDWRLFYNLTMIAVSAQELPFAVDNISLTCRTTTPLQTRTQTLDFENTRRKKTSTQDFAITIAKLKARLGEDAVYKLSYRDHCIPEFTNIAIPLSDQSIQILPQSHSKSLRPTWLLEKPELIMVKNDRLYWDGYLECIIGPERIVGAWWDDAIARDYYQAKRHDNLRIWIFHNLHDKAWYVHGVFT